MTDDYKDGYRDGQVRMWGRIVRFLNGSPDCPASVRHAVRLDFNPVDPPSITAGQAGIEVRAAVKKFLKR